MKKDRLLGDYLRCLPFYLIVFYMTTAAPSGVFHLKWHFFNILLTVSYLVYPLTLQLLPILRKPFLLMTSLSTRAAQKSQLKSWSFNNWKNNWDRDSFIKQNAEFHAAQRDNIMNVFLLGIESGLIMLFSIPIILIASIILKLRKHKNDANQQRWS